jgi:hypothetical protein
MILSSSTATYGVRSTSRATSPGVVGNVLIGQQEEEVSLSPADVAWTAQILLARATAATAIELDIRTGNVISFSPTWVAGNGQAQTATVVAAAGCTTNGTMTLAVTSAGMPGSPLNVAVPLTTAVHTTAALIAGAARAALAANATIAARFTVSGTGNGIVLTRIGFIYKMAFGDVQVHSGIGDDATFGFGWAGALGIAALSLSTGTISGATEGILCPAADGKDWEGDTLTAIADGRLGAIQIANSATSTGGVTAASTVGFAAMPIPPMGAVLVVAPKLDSKISGELQLTVEANNTSALVHVTVVGRSV